MSDRKRKTKDPCQACFLHKDLCICALTPRLALRTRVLLLIHAKELKRTTNTGRLAVRALSNSEMRVRGLVDKPVNLEDIESGPYRNLLFFPSESAAELTAELVASDSRPIQLIVPDGNWRQASKVPYRHKELAGIPHIKISAKNTASVHLRAEHTPEGMATLEAIAHALRIIEGENVYCDLMGFFNAKLERTLIGRGQKNAPVEYDRTYHRRVGFNSSAVAPTEKVVP